MRILLMYMRFLRHSSSFQVLNFELERCRGYLRYISIGNFPPSSWSFHLTTTDEWNWGGKQYFRPGSEFLCAFIRNSLRMRSSNGKYIFGSFTWCFRSVVYTHLMKVRLVFLFFSCPCNMLRGRKIKKIILYNS